LIYSVNSIPMPESPKETCVLIIHGYSDCSESFVDIRNFLDLHSPGKIKSILYADYESREDNLTFEDVVEGLNDQLIAKNIIFNDGTSVYVLKIVVHSTGGLVVRHWIWRYYYATKRMSVCPVRNLVMLAPANFGSPLAQMGKSFLGALVKGRWKVGDFLEAGKKILDGLELGSAYQWNLAHRDLLILDNYFNARQIRTTVLVGSADYDGIRGWLNKDGTDGTVVIAGTNLNTIKLCLKFGIPDSLTDIYLPHQWSTDNCASDIAFGILHDLNHGSIVDKAAKESTDPKAVSNLLLRALAITEPDFAGFKSELEGLTKETYQRNGKPKFQQFIVHAVDYHEMSVRDFTLEFVVYDKNQSAGNDKNRSNVRVADIGTRSHNIKSFEDKVQSKAEYEYSREINEILTKHTHAFSQDTSYRRLLINTYDLKGFIDKVDDSGNFPEGWVICMKVFVPPIDKNITHSTQDLQNIVLYDSSQSDIKDMEEADNVPPPEFFFEDTTTLLEIQVERNNSYVYIGDTPRNH
jgi:hypothetical protein